jgi:hypothetical protein
VVDIHTKDYKLTREMAGENKHDWKKLMAEAEGVMSGKKKKRKKK